MNGSLDRAADVSRETLEAFAALLQRWTRKINLVGSLDTNDLWDRHILDCARLADLIPHEAKTYADLGTGAGLPGLVVAILRPDLSTTLIESDNRKAAFLRAARRDLSLNARIICNRIEVAAPQSADVVSARALAPLPDLLRLATRHGGPATYYLFPKGERWEREVAEARRAWSFDLQVSDSRREGAGPVLLITNVSEIA
ncbi:16S rRNA (guanine(527)-N(7))-methyltransferase RsmG [Jannaschia formosa]|uniref:16S rRNA (guanine(527)-N(7))-methyltransferase RsmG n=1 Tax=Jannaschia formosa TaxID=2259592 RepID=UPI000E1BC786|nr:16S rRNA (guanine(527)-N(7))-methyltransferase RsmG [Jannaschia formosa]TFL17556.1 16S rRNA (guanine(527)-N(7))-methyltransferase RsmG [Jannaschia formosa]